MCSFGTGPTILDAIPALAWSAGPDGRVEFFNRHYLDFLGLSAEQAVASGWTAAVHPRDLGTFSTTWASIMASQAPGETEARLRRHDGDYRWFVIRVNPVRDETGAIVKWYGVNTDIEGRKRAQAELQRAVGALTASVAHEVNQPLSGIITNASTCLRMLHSSPPNLDGARQTVQRLLRDGKRAVDVIQRLRALFGRREFAPEPLDLNEATREVIALSSSDLQRSRVILRSEFADDLPIVTGDRIQLQQVILNLLSNAVDAMADLYDRPRYLQIKTERDDDDRLRLTVCDVGVGLAPANLESIFDAFYTTKSGGMGIGLFVSRSIIERHQGRLWAQPNDGPGASFAFSIPRQASPTAKPGEIATESAR